MGELQNTVYDIFEGVGKFEVPEILPVYEIPKYDKFIEFDYCYRCTRNREKTGVHFFEDDYKFERCWSNPDRYGELLSKFQFVVGPDYSMYVEFPTALKIYNHYRNNWLCRYWQDYFNVRIIPTVLWGHKDTFDWCFDGFPKNSVVAVSTVGLFEDKEMKELFMNGYNEMLRVLNPSKILVYTRTFTLLPGNVEYVAWTIHKGEQI